MGRKPRQLAPNQIYHNTRRDYVASLQFHIAAGKYLQRHGWEVEEIRAAFKLLTVQEIDAMLRKMKQQGCSKYQPH